MEAKVLPADVADKYEMLTGHGVGEYHWSDHRLRLDRITLELANILVAAGFPYLVAKESIHDEAPAELQAGDEATS